MSNMVVLPINNGCFYVVPVHEFNRYWAEHLKPPDFNDVPTPSKIAALKRGKGYKRYQDAVNQKGSGKHAPY